MELKPWYTVATPREDLREGRPLDASEFAVHLDQVRDGRAPVTYQCPASFFDRTYLTRNLAGLSVEVIRRLSGIMVETSAVFNLTTQFGGGKTHALTALYHLAQGGKEATKWKGVRALLDSAGVTKVPEAATGVFVGTEFDSITGRGGDDGSPIRRTPWAEIAWQLGGTEAFRIVEKHDDSLTAPGGDVVARILPENKPVLVLLDELMNYVSRSRKSGLSGQLYSFLHNLSEVARVRENVVLAVSIPASELEMTAEDQSDYERFKKLLDRLGKPVIMSVEEETTEIIKRRLFEWDDVPADASTTVDEYVNWMVDHRHQLPSWFAVDNARATLAASYPFHPSVLSVFERKWQTLPRFQQTRGILRLLALWVSYAYGEGFKGAHRDTLITLGTAPLNEPSFRATLFEQLGETLLEAAVTTDITGKEYAHATRLDNDAPQETRNARLHRKVATTVFFESNGGQQRGEATLSEIRLAVAEPNLEMGSVEQCLEALADTCYFLSAEKSRYRFSLQPNLNKLLADRRASVPTEVIHDRVRSEIQAVFASGSGVERIFFPARTNQVPDRALLTLVVLPPENEVGNPDTMHKLETIINEHGSSSRVYKSAIIWSVAGDATLLSESARKVLAWEDIESESNQLRIVDSQRRQLDENLKRAKRDLRESVWRSYRYVFLLDEKSELHRIDLGLVHSSAADSPPRLILDRLRQEDLVVDVVSPNFLLRHWPPALPEWSTRAVRDTFFASPKFPRLPNPDVVKQTILRGIELGLVAYAGIGSDGNYKPFVFREPLDEDELEIAEDVFLITREAAEAYLERLQSAVQPFSVSDGGTPADKDPNNNGSNSNIDTTVPTTSETEDLVHGFRWVGEVAPQKWMSYYTKVISRLAQTQRLKLTVTVELQPDIGVAKSTISEVQVALRELGLSEEIHFRTKP